VKTIAVGVELPMGEFLLKHASVMTFDMSFWEDEEATIPGDLTGAVVSMVVESTSGAVLATWPAVNSSNKATWTLTSVQTTTTSAWERSTYVIKIAKSGDSEIILAGPVRIQKVR